MPSHELINLFNTTGYTVFNNIVDIRLIEAINKKTRREFDGIGKFGKNQDYLIQDIKLCKKISKHIH